MAGRAVIVLAALACGACGRGEVIVQPVTNLDAQFVKCRPGTFKVVFDPAERVAVTHDGQEVAFASFERRSTDGACGSAVPATSLSSSLIDAGRPRAVVYHRVELQCAASEPVEVAVHAIADGDHPGQTVGSVLTLRAGDATIVSAVLKNKGDPQASRVYRAADVCRL
jgi:hypothetical protein